MSAYIIADLTIHDPAGYADYARQVSPLVEKYGGRFVVQRGNVVPLEGDAPKDFIAVQFESMADAKRFFDAPEYAAPRALRLKCATGNVFIVEGL